MSKVANLLINVSLASEMVLGGKGIPASDLALVLQLLPPGSRIVGFGELPIDTLHRVFQLQVQHPTFDLGGDITALYERHAYLDGSSETVQQFGLLKGLDLSRAGSIYKLRGG